MKNSVELKELRAQAKEAYTQIIENAKAECRSLTEEEVSKLDTLKQECEQFTQELRNLKEQLVNYEKNTPSLVEVREEQNKNITNKTMNYSIVKEIREAMANGSNKFNIESRAATVGGFTTGEGENAVKHDTTVVEDEVKSILEPLYANSVLTKLGATWYTGMPMGNINVPIMSKNTVGWAGETAQASSTQSEFTTVKLTPKRLTAYIDISKMLIAQDTIGVENALRRDIINALNDKLEATILGDAAGDENKPAGIFNGVQSTTVASYKDICDLEAELELSNATGNVMYLSDPKTKAYFRQLAKSSKNTQLVYENGEVDGTPLVWTSNIPAKNFIVGNFKDLIIAAWDNIEVVVDPYTQSVNGCIRLVINAYFDAKFARLDCVKFGNIA